MPTITRWDTLVRYIPVFELKKFKSLFFYWLPNCEQEYTFIIFYIGRSKPDTTEKIESTHLFECLPDETVYRSATLFTLFRVRA